MVIGNNIPGSQSKSSSIDPIPSNLLDALKAGTDIVIVEVTEPSGDKKVEISSTAAAGMVGGSGTTGTLPKWTAATTLGDSIISESGAVITVTGDLIATGLTASQIVETDGSKQLISAAKGTAYNKAFGIGAGTVMEGNQAAGGDASGTLDNLTISGGGIYSGSGSLSGATVVTMATNNLQFNSTGRSGLLTIDAVNDKVMVGQTTSAANAFGVASGGVGQAVVVSSGAVGLFIVDQDAGGSGAIRLQDSTPTSRVQINSAGLSFFDGGDVVMGRVTPLVNNRLVVRGASATTSDFALRLENSGGGTLATFRNDGVSEFNGNIGLGTPGGFEVGIDNTLTIFNGTAPTISQANQFIMYSADASGAGTASPHFFIEGSTVIVLADISQMVSLTLSGNLLLGATTAVSGILDEDDLVSNSATDLATQQSIKSYVDSSANAVADFFFNDTVSDIGGIYRDQTNNGLGGGESTLTTAGLIASTNDQALFNFATLTGEPGILSIPSGIFDVHFHAERTAGSSSVNLYAEIYKRASGGAEVLITTTEISAAVTAKTDFTLHANTTADTDLLVTDRVVVKFFANLGSGSGATVALYQEGTTVSHLSIPSTVDILNQIFIRQDGTKAMTGDFDLGGNDIINGGVILLNEQAAAETSAAGIGQVWVKTATPNELWFTDDASNDREIAFAGGAFHDGFSDFVSGEHFLQSAITEVGTVTTGNVDAVVSAATTSLAGKLEIALTSEIDSSTANRAMTPDLFKASDFGRKNVGVALFGTETAVTVLAIGTDDLPSFPVPASMNGWELIDVVATVTDKGVTGTTTVNVNRRRAGANVAMLSTGVTLGDEWFANDGAVNAANDDLATGDEITAYVTGIHSGTAPNGLFVTYTFEQP